MDKVTSKAKLVESGALLIKEKGFNNTGILEVLQTVGIPKGSFYHFFTNKEDFGLHVLRHYIYEHDTSLGVYLLDVTKSPLTRFRNYFEAACQHYERLGFRQGCLVGNLSQELADQNESFRQILEAQLGKWQQVWLDCLQEAQTVGEISVDWDISDLAQFCLNSWEGAVLRMKVSKSVAPLQTFIKLVFEQMLKS